MLVEEGDTSICKNGIKYFMQKTNCFSSKQLVLTDTHTGVVMLQPKFMRFLLQDTTESEENHGKYLKMNEFIKEKKLINSFFLNKMSQWNS